MKTNLRFFTFSVIAILVLTQVSPAQTEQKKKVAVVTFYVNKYVGVESMGPAAGLGASIAMLAKDTNFNLQPILNNFHEKFFNEYSKEFPFELANESEVINNEGYKNFNTLDTSSFWAQNALLMKGYNYSQASIGNRKDVRKLIEIYKGQYDGFIWVFINFDIAPKVAFGGLGVAGVRANANIYCYNKNEDKVFNIYEYCMSKESVGMVGGLPLIETKAILPLCQDASDKLLSDLYKKLPKITRKATKNL